jgi:two-component system cell cycle sensor histidine kinase/response regulator CckA
MSLRTILFVLALLAFLSASVGGFLYYTSLRESALKEAESHAALEAETMAMRASSPLAERQRAVTALAGLQELHAALRNGSKEALARAGRVLDRFRAALEVEACYLVDRHGNTIASSKQQQPDKLVGQDSAFRPYFHEAVWGRPAVFLAGGSASGAPGIYHSCSVREPANDLPVGVVVIKASMDSLEREFSRGSDGISFLTDHRGRILFANRQEWVRQILWKRTPEMFSGIVEARLFAAGLWNNTGLEMTGDHRAADGSGHEYLIYQAPVEHFPGWQFVYLVSLKELSRKVFDPLVRTGISIVVTLCILVGLAVFVLYATASSDILRQKETAEALRASEEKLQAITGSAPDAIILMDDQGQISYWNPAAEKMFGYTAEEALGRDLHRFLAPEEYHEAYQRGFVAFKDRGTGPVVGRTLEFVAKKKDGSPLPIEISTSAINVKDQWHAAGIIRDITERKQAEQSLRESEEKYRNILESIEEGFFEVDRAGNFTFVNDSICAMSGYSRNEIQGMNNRAYTAPETATRMFRVFSEIYRTGRPATMLDYEIIRKDGTVKILELSASLRRDSAGRPVGFRGIVRDVTERQRAEEALRESEEKYRTVLEANPDPVVVCDRESRVLYFNPAFTRVFGWTLEERLGRPLERFVPEDNQAETKMTMERLMAGESFFGFESRRYSKGGQILPVSVSGTVYRDRDGNPVGSIINLRDITEQKKLQGQLQHAQKMEAVGTLAGGIAHDFNNLLQAVQGYAELLSRGKPKDHPDCAGLQKILNAAKRGAELTRQLLTFSRKVESRKRPLDLNHEVHEIRRLLERTLPRMIDIELHLAEDLKIANADPVQMEQVLMNLAVNSKDAMPQGGGLLIETKNVTLDVDFCKNHLGSRPGDYVMLGVSDTGHGMDGRTIAHIFEPFYTTKGPGQGTGLGLAMVYGIVKEHEGYITCHSAPGVGTTFKIYLPTVDEPAEAHEERERVCQVKKGSEIILLVDDEEFIRDVAVQLLREFGYTVLTAANGEAALEIYRKEHGRIDLVILDLIMPGMGGMKCLREILKVNPQGRVLVASGYSAGGPAREAIDAGARGYLGKPYDIDKMLSVIREVLDKISGRVAVH